jgi:O-antigen ligase
MKFKTQSLRNKVVIFLVPGLLNFYGWFGYAPILYTVFFLTIGTLIALFLSRDFKLPKSKIYISIVLMLPSYLISILLNNQNLFISIIGAHQRYFGLASLLCIIIIFIICSRSEIKIEHWLKFGLGLALVTSNFLGLMQALGVDFFINPTYKNVVTLTFGNPNFAGAFIGMLSIINLYFLLKTRSIIYKYFWFAMFCLSVFLSIKTDSLQSPILIILNFSIVFLILGAPGLATNKFSIKQKNYISRLFILIVIIITLFLVNYFSRIKYWFSKESNFNARIDYWGNGIGVWKDHLFFGVGIDNLQNFAAIHKTNSQVMRDGSFVIPDKSHNVFIDHLANGGLVSGCLWLIFVSSIIYIIFSLNRLILSSRLEFSILASIFIIYIFQSMISPDHLILTLVGWISAGLLVNLYFNFQDLENLFIKEIKVFTKLQTTLVLIVSSFILILMPAISADIKTRTLVEQGILDKKAILNLINSWPNTYSTERFAIAALQQSTDECDFATQLANRLSYLNSRSGQAWFIKSICSFRNDDIQKAIREINSALLLDPKNSYYLVSKAKYFLSISDIDRAFHEINLAKNINPNEVDLVKVERRILELRSN